MNETAKTIYIEGIILYKMDASAINNIGNLQISTSSMLSP
jgi:hypothetical protein